MQTLSSATAAAEVKAGHDEFVFPAVKPYYREPIVIADVCPANQ